MLFVPCKPGLFLWTPHILNLIEEMDQSWKEKWNNVVAGIPLLGSFLQSSDFKSFNEFIKAPQNELSEYEEIIQYVCDRVENFQTLSIGSEALYIACKKTRIRRKIIQSKALIGLLNQPQITFHSDLSEKWIQIIKCLLSESNNSELNKSLVSALFHVFGKHSKYLRSNLSWAIDFVTNSEEMFEAFVESNEIPTFLKWFHKNLSEFSITDPYWKLVRSLAEKYEKYKQHQSELLNGNFISLVLKCQHRDCHEIFSKFLEILKDNPRRFSNDQIPDLIQALGTYADFFDTVKRISEIFRYQQEQGVYFVMGEDQSFTGCLVALNKWRNNDVIVRNLLGVVNYAPRNKKMEFQALFFPLLNSKSVEVCHLVCNIVNSLLEDGSEDFIDDRNQIVQAIINNLRQNSENAVSDTLYILDAFVDKIEPNDNSKYIFLGLLETFHDHNERKIIKSSVNLLSKLITAEDFSWFPLITEIMRKNPDDQNIFESSIIILAKNPSQVNSEHLKEVISLTLTIPLYQAPILIQVTDLIANVFRKRPEIVQELNNLDLLLIKLIETGCSLKNHPAFLSAILFIFQLYLELQYSFAESEFAKNQSVALNVISMLRLLHLPEFDNNKFAGCLERFSTIAQVNHLCKKELLEFLSSEEIANFRPKYIYKPLMSWYLKLDEIFVDKNEIMRIKGLKLFIRFLHFYNFVEPLTKNSFEILTLQRLIEKLNTLPIKQLNKYLVEVIGFLARINNTVLWDMEGLDLLLIQSIALSCSLEKHEFSMNLMQILPEYFQIRKSFDNSAFCIDEALVFNFLAMFKTVYNLQLDTIQNKEFLEKFTQIALIPSGQELLFAESLLELLESTLPCNVFLPLFLWYLVTEKRIEEKNENLTARASSLLVRVLDTYHFSENNKDRLTLLRN